MPNGYGDYEFETSYPGYEYWNTFGYSTEELGQMFWDAFGGADYDDYTSQFYGETDFYGQALSPLIFGGQISTTDPFEYGTGFGEGGAWIQVGDQAYHSSDIMEGFLDEYGEQFEMLGINPLSYGGIGTLADINRDLTRDEYVSSLRTDYLTGVARGGFGLSNQYDLLRKDYLQSERDIDIQEEEQYANLFSQYGESFIGLFSDIAGEGGLNPMLPGYEGEEESWFDDLDWGSTAVQEAIEQGWDWDSCLSANMEAGNDSISAMGICNDEAKAFILGDSGSYDPYEGEYGEFEFGPGMEGFTVPGIGEGGYVDEPEFCDGVINEFGECVEDVIEDEPPIEDPPIEEEEEVWQSGFSQLGIDLEQGYTFTGIDDFADENDLNNILNNYGLSMSTIRDWAEEHLYFSGWATPSGIPAGDDASSALYYVHPLFLTVEYLAAHGMGNWGFDFSEDQWASLTTGDTQWDLSDLITDPALTWSMGVWQLPCYSGTSSSGNSCATSTGNYGSENYDSQWFSGDCCEPGYYYWEENGVCWQGNVAGQGSSQYDSPCG